MRPATSAAIARPDLIVIKRAPRPRYRVRAAVVDGVLELVVVFAIVSLVLIPPSLAVLVLERLWRSL